MNYYNFNKRDYLIVILAIILISFGITMPIGILLIIFLILNKINQYFQNEDNNKTFSTLFFN
ncbi:MAG: hypothetical protein CO032_07945 [Nitrosopumilales archaeon CG_4_9_14_0_2_um_filter_34_16]|nr:MAG: hypothetical protein CO032_07945 [Nitrosopumilales archaeon CG_4_9_14_0_2_um_filter_34_16]